MVTKKYKDVKELSIMVSEKFRKVKKDFGDVAVIGFYPEIKELIRRLICFGYDIGCISIKSKDVNGYDAEWIMSLCVGDNGEGEIWCENMVGDDGEYLYGDATVLFIHDTCSSAALVNSEADEVIDFYFDDDNDDCSDCKSPCGEACCKKRGDVKVTLNGKQIHDQSEKLKAMSEVAKGLSDTDKEFNELLKFFRL